jgi:hypothetical protein
VCVAACAYAGHDALLYEMIARESTAGNDRQTYSSPSSSARRRTSRM